MPLFAPHEIRHLVGDRTEAEAILDLCGADRQQAHDAIERLLEHGGLGPSTRVIIRLDPATPTSGETLFLPVGRHLLAARRQRRIARFSTLPDADGGGFYLEFATPSPTELEST
ncbi:MAG: hypothetical protein EA420_14010 [Candidatus Competibacteraceae bacterium]|nr:MAG: hypothetical protein EA420_14010 [Candidatus Competibacteraceae bacterium]